MAPKTDQALVALRALAAKWRNQAALCEERRGIPRFQRDGDRHALLIEHARELEGTLAEIFAS